MRGGKPAEITDFRANDWLTATIITTKPPRVVTEKDVQATLARASAGAGTPAATVATPVQSTSAAAAPSAPAAAAPKKLPKTASPLPVLGLAGFVSLATGVALTIRRRRVTR